MFILGTLSRLGSSPSLQSLSSEATRSSAPEAARETSRARLFGLLRDGLDPLV